MPYPITGLRGETFWKQRRQLLSIPQARTQEGRNLPVATWMVIVVGTSMPKAVFDRQRCKGCRLCIEACPRKLIDLSGEKNENGYLTAEIVDDKECTGCGFCFLICPDLAVTILANTTGQGD